MQEHGFYIIKDRFFEKMQDPYLKGNKGQNRPHYYCIRDSESGLCWMIPLSSRISKYQKIIEKKEQRHQPCDVLHIAKLANGKAHTIIGLIKRGIHYMPTQPDVPRIMEKINT